MVQVFVTVLYIKKKHTYWYASFPTGSYLCTLHMLPVRSHILRTLAVTFIAVACWLATKRRLDCTLWVVPHALKRWQHMPPTPPAL